MPRVMVSVRVRLERVLDVTNGSIRSSLRLSEARLVREPWRLRQESGEEALTQAVGRVAKEAGWERCSFHPPRERAGLI